MTVNKRIVAISIFIVVVIGCFTFFYVSSLKEERDQLKKSYKELHAAYTDLDNERIELMTIYADELYKLTEENEQTNQEIKNVIIKALEYGYAQMNQDTNAVRELLSSDISLNYIDDEPYLNYKVDNNDIKTRLYYTHAFDLNQLYIADYNVESESIMVKLRSVGKDKSMDADILYFQELVFKEENGNWLIHAFGDQIIKSIVVFSAP